MVEPPVVALIGTLDTRGGEYEFVAGRLEVLGCTPMVVDVGVLGTPGTGPDVDRQQVAAAGGADLAALVAAGDRGEAMTAMARGAAVVVEGAWRAGRVHAVMAVGGSNAAYVMATVCRRLRHGVPKLLVSTVAAGNTRPYLAGLDLTLVNPVVDVVGLNRLTRPVLTNAAAAVAAMATQAAALDTGPALQPAVGVTMSGITTAGTSRLVEQLRQRGQEPLVFHANGAGGEAMENLIERGEPVVAVADVTTTELADELVGGTRSAGPTRLEAAGAAGIPQVVSLGGLDVVNFGPPATVPVELAHRRFYRHNPSVTLMRTEVEECAALGRLLAAKLNRARGPVSLVIPEGGLSALSVQDAPLAHPVADHALVDALLSSLDASVVVARSPHGVNHPELIRLLDQELRRLVTEPSSV